MNRFFWFKHDPEQMGRCKLPGAGKNGKQSFDSDVLNCYTGIITPYLKICHNALKGNVMNYE